jgi:hypothetical protein
MYCTLFQTLNYPNYLFDGESFFMVFQNTDDVIKAMQPIFDDCAKKDNGIDGIAFLVGPSVQGKSRVPGFGGEFDATIAPQLLETFDETTKDKLNFSQDTNLEFVSFMNKNGDNGEMQMWTLITVFSSYRLVFTGKFTKESRQFTHLSSVPLYIEKLLPLIKEYDKLA